MVDNLILDKIKKCIENSDFEQAEIIISKFYEKSESAKLAPLLALAKSYLGKYGEALDIFEIVIDCPENQTPEIYDRLITCCTCLKLREKAFKYAEDFFKKYPENEDAMSQYVETMMYIGKIKEAEKLCTDLIQKYSNYEKLWIRMGILVELIYCNDELAKECYEKVIELNPKNLSGYNNLAIVSSKLGDFNNAEKLYMQIIKECPNNNDVKKSLGLLYLKQRRFKEGYENFIQRPLKGSENNIKFFWNGVGKLKELSVICDQGFGDHIQFIRYLPFLKEKTDKMSVYCYKGLTELFKNNYKGSDSISFFDDKGEFPDIPSLLLTNVAYFLNMDFDNIPFKEGYLKCNEEKFENYKKTYFDNEKFKIGVCWEAGATEVRELIHKTINIKYFEPLFDLPRDKYEFYSFQNRPLNEHYKEYKMIDLGQEFTDFDDTAAAMKNLDLLITVDTANAHLGGALGVNTIMLLPYCSDWRWFDNKEKTEWYSSVKIIKQQNGQTWEPEIQQVINFLQNL